MKLFFKIFLTVVFCALTTGMSSQTSSLKVTESVEFKEKTRSDEVLAIHTSQKGETVTVRNSKKHLVFDLFDSKLNKIYNNTVETHKRETYVGDLFYENELKVFTVFEPKKKERIVYCHVFDLNNKTHKKVELFKKTVEKNQPIFSGANKRQTSFALSPDGAFIAIYTDDIKKNSNSYTVYVYNASSLELAYKKQHQEHKEQYFEPNDLVIDNSANVYSVGKLYLEGRSEKKKGKANYNFILTKLNQSESEDLKIIPKDEEQIRSLAISQFDNNLKLLGFYSHRDEPLVEPGLFGIRTGKDKIRGVLVYIVNPQDLTIKNSKSLIFPEKMYNDLYGYRKSKKKSKKGLTSFYIDHVITDANGNTFILAEEFYITQVYVANGQFGGSWQTVYHYDDVLVLKLNSSDDLEWGRSIFKRATSPSYNAFLKDDKLHVILNSGKNLTEKKDGRTKVSKGWFESSALYDFEYDSNGNVNYNKIQDNRKKTYYVPFFGTYQDGKFIMVGDKKKKQFMSLE